MRGNGRIWKRIAAFMLAVILSVSMIPVGSWEAQAAGKKPELSRKSVSVYVGKTVTVKLKRVKKKVKWQIISGKKVVSIKKSGKYKNTVVIRGKKAGKAKVRATHNKKKYVVKVNVKEKKVTTNGPTISTEDKNTTTPEHQVTPGSGNSNGNSGGTVTETPGPSTENGGNAEGSTEGETGNSGSGSEETPEEGSTETGNSGNGSEETPEEGSTETGNSGSGSEETPEEGNTENGNSGNGSEEMPEEGSTEGETGNSGSGSEETPEEGSTEGETGNSGSGSEESPEEGSTEGETENSGSGSEETPEEGSTENEADGSGSEETPEEGSTQEGNTEGGNGNEEGGYEEETPAELPKNVVLDSYFDKMDVASSSTIGQGNETSDKLFDGNLSTKWYTSDFCPVRIAWEMKHPVVLKKYTLTTGADSATYSHRNPQTWHLYGSNDATTWTQIDTVDVSGIEAKNTESYTYETDVQDAYLYYSLQIESNSGNKDGYVYAEVQLAEISMFGDVAQVTDETGVSLASYYDTIDTSATTVSGYGNEVVENLFDGNLTTKVYSASAAPCSIAWKMTQATSLYSYTLTTANDSANYTGRNPKAWKLYGSNDGNSWTQIDKVNNSGMKDENYTAYTYTVDAVGTYQYYKLEITELNGNSFQLSEIELKGAAVSPSEYDIMFTGDWDLVTSEGYVDELVKLFYNSYPRLYARWAHGTEPRTITFKADSTYDGVAYCQGTTVVVSTAYANANPNDIGFFSHEITHSVQQYNGTLNYGDDVAWWTENMANYGGFRYFHWSNPKYVQVYEASDTSLQDWGYEQYGNNKWFFAYMDSRYPTRKDDAGNITYGLIDSINNLIKNNNTGTAYTDDPYDTTTTFNQVVYQVTGYDCIESLRLKYVEELQAGTWTFEGFANYEDNWITENITGVKNPEYPMLGEKIHGDKTATQLNTAVTSGTNLCTGASVLENSGYTKDTENAAMLIDGNLTTKWCATRDSVKNPEYKLNGVAHWIKLDLGSQQTFDTYTIYNTQSQEGYGNATEWEVLISNDGENWTSVDYQSYNNNAVASFDIGEQTARYVFIKVFTPDNGVGTLRLYEFQLYNR